MTAVRGKRVAALVEHADRALRALEGATLRRIDAALLDAAERLELELGRLTRAALAELKGETSAAVREARARAVLGQVRALLDVTGDRAKDIEAGLVDAYRNGSHEAVELAALYDPELEGAARIGATLPFAATVRAANASARLTSHGAAFALEAERVVVSGVVRGAGFSSMATALREATGALLERAEVIVRTETVTANDEARRGQYGLMGVGLVQRVATQDAHLCAFCAARAGLVYEAAEAPACIHPNDRCYNAPFKREWLRAGLVDVDWWKTHREDCLRRLAVRGLKPDEGPAPFERAAGRGAPAAVWAP